MRATIPRFHDTDPSVFVLFSEPDDEEAVLEFERDTEGDWRSLSKITAVEEVARLKRKISQLTVATVP